MRPITNQEMKSLLDDLMKSCEDWVEAIVIISEEGAPIMHSMCIDLEPDYIAVASSAILGSASAVLELLNSRGFDSIDVRLKEGRYLLVRRYEDYYLAALTRPEPNLGFISLALEAYLPSRR